MEGNTNAVIHASAPRKEKKENRKKSPKRIKENSTDTTNNKKEFNQNS